MTQRRIPGLDGIRFPVLMLVVLGHQNVIWFGQAAMQLFFPLSGYLITRILWATREQPLGAYLKRFYIGRVLRILPLYYGAVFALSALAFATHKGESVKPLLPWLLTYSYNLRGATSAYTINRFFGHFWSLCLEEQFYLLWPLMIFYCSKRSIKPVLIGLVLLGPLVRLVEVLLLRAIPGAQPNVALGVYWLTPTQIDGFAIGALIGLFPLGGRRLLLLLSFAVLAIAVSLHPFDDPRGFGNAYVLLWYYSAANVFYALLFDCLAFQKLLPQFFDFPLVRYLGSITYGVYVFHLPVQSMLEDRIPNAALWLRICLQILVTTALAALSFEFFEGPFLRLKARFNR